MNLKTKLDRIFAEYIRKRDSKDGYFVCISCGKTKPTSQQTAGHYHSRRYMSLRYDEENVNGQCLYCNFYLHGNVQGQVMGLRKKYGRGILDRLILKKAKKVKYQKFEYEQLIKEYQNKIKCI